MPEGEEFDPVAAGLVPPPDEARTDADSDGEREHRPGRMNALDLVLLLLLLAYAVSGYWQGFITGAFATVGLLARRARRASGCPRCCSGDADPSVWVSLGALFVVLLCASFGQALLQFVGARLREQITWQPVRAVDAVGGAALSVVAVLVVSWALGVAVSGARLPWVTKEVRDSTILGAGQRA